jgi:hypothetical protein
LGGGLGGRLRGGLRGRFGRCRPRRWRLWLSLLCKRAPGKQNQHGRGEPERRRFRLGLWQGYHLVIGTSGFGS